MKTMLVLLLLGATIAGCADAGEDRIDNIQKLKILAVKAEHPDLLPGETTSVKVLVASPRNGSVTTALVPMSHDGRDAGLAFAFAAGSSEPSAPIQAEGVSRAKPQAAELFYTAPQAPGVYDLAALVQEGTPDLFAPESALKALKTVRVRKEGEPLNENPNIERVVLTKRWKIVDGKQKALPVDGMRVEPGEVVRLQTVFTDETPERASAVWWVTGGEVEDYGRQDMDFVAPKGPGIVTVVALMLDRDNGSDWSIQDLAVGIDALTPEVAGDNPLLVSSGGRFLWIALDSKERMKLIQAGGKATVSVEIVMDESARLGWRAEKASLAGGRGIFAGDVSERSAGPALLTIDGIISRTE